MKENQPCTPCRYVFCGPVPVPFSFLFLPSLKSDVLSQDKNGWILSEKGKCDVVAKVFLRSHPVRYVLDKVSRVPRPPIQQLFQL